MPYTTEERNELGFYRNFQGNLRNEYLERLKTSLENDFRDENNVLFSFENIIPDETLKIGLGLETVDTNSDLYKNYIDDKQLDLAKSTIPIHVKYPIYDKSSLLEVTIDRKITARNKTAVDTGTSDSTDDCNTTATTEARYNNGESARKYIFKPVAEESGTRAEERFYLYNGTYYLCITATCGNLIANQKVTYGQGTGSSKYQTQQQMIKQNVKLL